MSIEVILVGTKDGFHAVGASMPRMPAGHAMTAVARTQREVWAIANRATLWRDTGYGEGAPITTLETDKALSLLPIGERLFVGASRANLYELIGSDLVRVESFDEVPGRERWHTPWGGPPDVRSMAAGPAGNIYVNVHVGGVVRSTDGGHSWEDTMDIDADVHQVTAHPTRPGHAFAAAAIGLGRTDDAAVSWTWDKDGLHATYCRAVAVSDEMIFVSASRGSGGAMACLYRKPLDGDHPFERCDHGLPEWFSDNLDTFCLVARGSTVVAGDADGTVYVSTDDGDTWDVAASGLPGVYCLTFV